tara:strand:- start:1278 stop:1835 length:558 start_codon:yes stop_codon:yes gene_type:complete
MWALVKASQVIEIINGPKAMTINGVQYPSSIFRIWKPAELKAIGLYSYTLAGMKDQFYYNIGAITHKVDDSAGTVVGTYASSAKPMSDLKEAWSLKIKEAAGSLISKYDWMTLRFAQSGTAIPKNVNTYMNSIRANSNIMETKVNAASDVDALVALDTTTYHANGDVNVLAHLQNWPKDPNAPSE